MSQSTSEEDGIFENTEIFEGPTLSFYRYKIADQKVKTKALIITVSFFHIFNLWRPKANGHDQRLMII